MRTYTPRRASSRWLDDDCPRGVLAIFDHPAEFEQFTVFYADLIESPGRIGYRASIGYRGMSSNPSHPQGIGIYDEMEAHEVAAYRYRNKHRMCKWSALPLAVRECVQRDLNDE